MKWAKSSWPMHFSVTYLRFFGLHLVSTDGSPALDDKNGRKTEIGQVDLNHFHVVPHILSESTYNANVNIHIFT